MGIRRAITIGCLLGASIWIWMAAPPAPAWPVELYSWFDPSGTLVLSDSLNRLPPSIPPAYVWVHRFQEDPPAPAPSSAPPPVKTEPPRAAVPSPPETPQTRSAKDEARMVAPSAPVQPMTTTPATNHMEFGQPLVLGVPLPPEPSMGYIVNAWSHPSIPSHPRGRR